MKVSILGGGCAKCNLLEKNALTAIEQLNLTAEVEHIKDYRDIAALGVMTTPALMLDGKLVSSGRVLTVDDVKRYITNAR